MYIFSLFTFLDLGFLEGKGGFWHSGAERHDEMGSYYIWSEAVK